MYQSEKWQKDILQLRQHKKTLEIESEVESEESEYGESEDEEFTAEMYAVLLLIYSKTLKV